MRHIFCLLVVFVGGDSLRPKVIGGTPAVANGELEFIAALLWCDRAGENCNQRCSGSLISPEFFLTAAHCIRPSFVSWGSTELSISLDSLFVLIGSVNYKEGQRSPGSRLVPIKAAFYGSYGTNILFPFDGDIALLQLSTCVSTTFGRVATRSDEPVAGSCTNVTVAGFGRVSNAPSLVRDSDGSLRYLVEKQHTSLSCSDAYSAIAGGFTSPGSDGQFPPTPLPAFKTRYAVVDENLICTGGTSPSSVCNGDSGGPTFFFSKSPIIVGVTSFIFNPGFCSIGPSYSTRVAFHAEWIRDVMASASSSCADWSIEQSFSSWPLPNWPNDDYSAEYKTSRCYSSQWQCASTECIDASRVCDGKFDCSDGSDENFFSSSGVRLCPNGPLGVRRLADDCALAVHELGAAIQDANAQWTVGDVWNTTWSTNACNAVSKSCIKTDVSSDFSQFCSEMVNFESWNSTVVTFAKTFGQRFNATCPDDGYLGWTRSRESQPLSQESSIAESTPHRIIVIILLALIALLH